MKHISLKKLAGGRLKTALEAEQIEKIWQGDIDRRTRAEMLRAGGGTMASAAELLKLLNLLPMLTEGLGGYGNPFGLPAAPELPPIPEEASFLPPPLPPSPRRERKESRTTPPPLPRRGN